MGPEAPHSSAIEIAVLGPIRAVADGRALELGGHRQQALLAALALHLGETVSVDVLIDAVWDGEPPAAAPRTFRTYVARLRKSFAVEGVDGAQVVLTDELGYRLNDDIVTVDSLRFAALVDEARDRLAVGEAVTALRLLDAALALWQGEAYAQFADQEWVRAEARRLQEQRMVARELHVQALLDAGRTDEAVVEADALDVEHPLRESVARLRVLGRYRLGRHADAVGVLRSFRSALADEAGLDPSSQLVELEQMVLQQDPRLDRPVAGRRLRGYLLKEVVATTALGTVHRAEQLSIGREVAITVVDAELADDPEVIRSFEARAQQIAAVEHPHVVPLYDYWREPGGAYLVTRFHPAGSLAQRLRAGSLDEAQLHGVVQQVGGALAAAHERGVVHGAVDADAVLLDSRGEAFLGGFRLRDPETGFATDLSALADLVAHIATRVGVGGGGNGTAPELERILDAARNPADAAITSVSGLMRRLDTVISGVGQPSAPAQTVTGPNPYRGLAAFQEIDADVFFGREELTIEVLGRLARQPFVAVSGPSGSGKSSVVRAGVLPRLRSEGAFVTTMVPGTAPLDELIVALSRIASVELPADAASRAAFGDAGLTEVIHDAIPTADGEAVLVIDQFEELFTITQAEERNAFLAAVSAALDHPGRRLRIIATVRADFLGRILEDPLAGSLVHRRTVLARPLTDDELHEAVTRPAEVAGVAVEPAFATAVVADAARFPGSLPMVQFALTEVFEAAVDGTMTLEAYRRIGGIEGVLGQRAEEVFQQLDEQGRSGARALFQRLVVLHDDGPPARRRALRGEFDHVADEVIDAFGRARLLRFDHDEQSREPTVEVTHEALFRAWPRLATWIEEDEEDLQLLGHLTVSATDWDHGGRHEADLYRGNRLDTALGFSRSHRRELSDIERAFLDASAERRVRDAEADRKTVRRLRTLTGGLAIGLILALVAGGLAVVAQRREAATAEAAQADALAFASGVLINDNLETAALLAAEAYAVSPDVESEAALLRVLAGEPRVRRILLGHRDGVCGTQPPGADVFVTQVVPPSGEHYALVTDFGLRELGRVTLPAGAQCPSVDQRAEHVYVPMPTTNELQAIDLATGEVVASRDDWGETIRFDALALAPDGTEGLLAASNGQFVRVGIPDLRTIAVVPIPDGVEVIQPSYSETGDLVGFGTGQGVAVHDVGGDTRLSEPVTDGTDFIFGVAIAEQTGVALALGDGGSVYAAPLPDLEGFQAVPLQGRFESQAAVNPEGDLVAIRTSEGVETFALPSLEPVGSPIGVPRVGTLTWGPAGELLWSGPGGLVTMDVDRSYGFGTVVSDVAEAGFNLIPARDGLSAIRFDIDGRHWVDLETGHSTVFATPDQRTTVVQALLPERVLLRVDVAGGTIERWRAANLISRVELPAEIPRTLEQRFSMMRVDHGLAVVALRDGPRGGTDQWVLVVDAATGEFVSAFARPPIIDGEAQADIVDVRAVGPDRLLVSTGFSVSSIVTLDGEPIVEPTPVLQGGEFSATSSDGTRIALAGFSREIVVTNGDLEHVVTLTGGTSSGATFLAFVADDRLVSRHGDGVTLLWDVAQGRLVGTLFESAGDRPWAFRVSPDTRTVVHATPSGVVKLGLDPLDWLAAVCTKVGRALEPGELEAVAPGRTALDPCAQQREVSAEVNTSTASPR